MNLFIYTHMCGGTAAQHTVHLPHGLHEVVRVLEADKAIAFGLLGVSVPDDLCLQEAGELGEGPGKSVVVYIVTKVTTEYPEVICRIGISIPTIIIHVH